MPQYQNVSLTITEPRAQYMYFTFFILFSMLHTSVVKTFLYFLGGLLSNMKDQQNTDVHVWLRDLGMALCCI